NLPPEHRPVELPGPVLIGNDEKVGDDETLLGCWEVFGVHLTPPFAEESVRLVRQPGGRYGTTAAAAARVSASTNEHPRNAQAINLIHVVMKAISELDEFRADK